MIDRLTGRTDEAMLELGEKLVVDLTFNELIAVAGTCLEPMQQKAQATNDREAGRDTSIAFTALEDALTRHNSAKYRLAETWKRADPDA